MVILGDSLQNISQCHGTMSVSSTASRAHTHISKDANIILRKPIPFDMMPDVIFVSINEYSIDKSESQLQIIHQQINRHQHHIRFFFHGIVGGWMNWWCCFKKLFAVDSIGNSKFD